MPKNPDQVTYCPYPREYPPLAILPETFLHQVLEAHLNPANPPQHLTIQEGDYTLAVANNSHPIGGLEHQEAKLPLLMPSYYPFVLIKKKPPGFSVFPPGRYRTNHWAFPNLGQATQVTEAAWKLRRLNPNLDPDYFKTGHHFAGNQTRTYQALETPRPDCQMLFASFGIKPYDLQQNPWPFTHLSERFIHPDGFTMQDTFEAEQNQPFTVDDHHYLVLGINPEDFANAKIEIISNGQVLASFYMTDVIAGGQFHYDLGELNVFTSTETGYELTARVHRTDGIVEVTWSGQWGPILNFFWPGTDWQSRNKDIAKSYGLIDPRRYIIAVKELGTTGSFKDFAAQGLTHRPSETFFVLAIQPNDGHQAINNYQAPTTPKLEGTRIVSKTIAFHPY